VESGLPQLRYLPVTVSEFEQKRMNGKWEGIEKGNS
jgi:hypothetical protein